MTHSILFLGVSLLIQFHGFSQTSSLARTANNFINALDEPQKVKAIYTFTDDERYNWHYFPKSDRKGISLIDLSPVQKDLALALLKSCLSDSGYAKTVAIVQLENILRVIEDRPDNEIRNSGKYYFTIFNKPDDQNIWGWRFEGHHISFNFSTHNNKVVSGTPGFLGASPAIVQTGKLQGKEVFREETGLGFALVNSFTQEQLLSAMSSSRVPNDIITFVSREAVIDNKEGITYSAMTNEQKKLFLKLIDVYIHRYTKLFADNMMQELNAAGTDHLRFIWAGTKRANGNPYYYRIQGPTIIIEYDNSQNNANHIHTVVRDLKRDFGGDELLEHYRKDHVK